jgi:reverse gyrase
MNKELVDNICKNVNTVVEEINNLHMLAEGFILNGNVQAAKAISLITEKIKDTELNTLISISKYLDNQISVLEQKSFDIINDSEKYYKKYFGNIIRT